MEGSATGRPYKPPELHVRSILNDYALQHETPELNVRPEIRNLSKFRASRKGRIRVNKEVLAILQQVSSELDAAQRHYLAHKQFGDAGESLLKLSPELFFLPSDGAAEAGAGDDEQDAGAADALGGTATSGTGAQNLLVGHRRWGYFSLLNKLKPVSAKRKPPPPPQQQSRPSISDAGATAAEAATEPEDWAEPDSPKASWAELMRQKKRAKEDSIAHMVRVRHAVLVIQRAWRKHLQKRASRALAMMMLRAKVRRAHRAAYVSNLLRRKTPGTSSSSGGEATGEGGGSEGAADDEDIQLTPQQEAELQEALQHVLEGDEINISDLVELQLTELMDRLNCKQEDSPAGSSITLAIGSSESSSEPEEEEAEEQQQGGWRCISTPKAPVKRPAGLRVATETPAGSSWQGSLRTPGGSLRTNSRLGTPELDLAQRGIIRSGSHRQNGLGSSSECSPCDSSESGSPRTPGWFGGPESPKRASISRHGLTSAGGVRVGKRMSVVLADAENAVAIAHGNGNVVVRAKSAVRQGHHSVSRLNPAAGSRTSAIADMERDSPSSHGNNCSSVEAAATAQSEQQLLLPGAADGRSSVMRSSLGNHTAAAAANGDLSHPICSRRTSRVSFNDEIDYLGEHKAEMALQAAVCSLTNDAVAAAVAAGFAAASAAAAAVGGADVCNGYTGESNAGQEWQQQLAQQWHEHCGTPIPDGLVQSLAMAAAQAGLQAGSQGWHEAMHQMQQHAMQQIMQQQQQQQVELQQQLGLAGDSTIASAATALLAGMPEGQSCGPGTAGVDAAAAAVAAITAVLGSGNNRLIPSGALQASHSASGRPPGNSRHGCASSLEPVAGGAHGAAEGSGAAAAAAGVPHYASPLPPGSSSPGRRCSSSSPDDGHRVDDSSLSRAGSQPGGTATSRRATREGGAPGSRGFVTTSSSGAAFNKYERGLGDGLQQDYRAIAAEALLAESRGPAAPPHPRRPGKVQSSPVEERFGEGRPRIKFVNEGFAKEAVQNRKEDDEVEELQQQQLLLDMLQQQLLAAARGLPDQGSLDGAVAFSFAGDDRSRQALQYMPDSEFDPVAATAAVAASMEQYNAASATAATAAAGQAGPLMQGLVLSQAGMCQQQQGQQQMRADGWYERLVARKKNVRQPWYPPASANDSTLQQQGLGDGAGKCFAEQGVAGSQDVECPTGHWGRRAKVHNAWLFIDGRQAAALPWQALAAATAAGSGAGSRNAAAGVVAKSVESAALDAAATFMEPNTALGPNRLKQLTVQGKKLLVKLMWMKSAARVLRSLGKNVGLSQVLERKVLTAIRNNTGPAGKQLLVWSVNDQQKQEQKQQQQQQQQQQLMLCMQLQQQLIMLHQQQRLGVLAPSLGLSAASSLKHPHLLSGSRIGLNPFPSSQQQLSLSDDVAGQHLPLLPAARARALGKALPAGQQQQLLLLLAQQQLLLLQQQQPEKFGDLLAAQCQQLTIAIAATAAPAMGNQQQQQQEWSPLQMQQLLQAQQRVWQQQQQQIGGKEVQAPSPDRHNLASDSSMREVPIVKKLVLARRGSRADALAAGGSGGSSTDAAAAASSGAAADTTGGGREHGPAAVADYAQQPAACGAGVALHTQRACATMSCSGASSAAVLHAAELRASHIQSPGDSSGSNTKSNHLAQQQKGKSQQQQEFQWLQSPLVPALQQPAGSLQVLGLRQQQQQGWQVKQVGQQPMSASWPSAAWQEVSKASGAQTGGPEQRQQQRSAFLLAQEQQQGGKAVSFHQQQQPIAVVMADDSSSIPAGPTYISFVTSTKFQPRMHDKPQRRRTDGSLLPSVGSGSAGALGAAATAIPNAARHHYLRDSSTGAVAAAAAATTVGMHVQRVNLGRPGGSNVQGLPSLVGSTQQQQLQLQYQQQQQQLRQGLVSSLQPQPPQQQQFKQPARSAGAATGLQQQQYRSASSELDSERTTGSAPSRWSVQAACRRTSRLSTSDPGSPALLADVQAAAAATTTAAVAGSNSSYSSETLHQQQTGVSGKKGHHKPLGVMQCTGRQAQGAGSAAVMRRPQPVDAVDCGSAAATGGCQQAALQHAAVALHQVQPQLPQLAPLRVATDLSPVGLPQQAKSAECVAVGGAVHSRQVLPTISPGSSPVTPH